MKFIHTVLVLCSLSIPALGFGNNVDHKIRESHLNDSVFPRRALRFGDLEIPQTTIQDMWETLGKNPHVHSETFGSFKIISYCYAVTYQKQRIWTILSVSSGRTSQLKHIDTILVTANPEKIADRLCLPSTATLNLHSGLALGMSYDETRLILFELELKTHNWPKDPNDFKFYKTYSITPFIEEGISPDTGAIVELSNNRQGISVKVNVEFKDQKLDTIKTSFHKHSSALIWR